MGGVRARPLSKADAAQASVASEKRARRSIATSEGEREGEMLREGKVLDWKRFVFECVRMYVVYMCVYMCVCVRIKCDGVEVCRIARKERKR